MNAWHQGMSQGRKGKFTDLFFFLSFFLFPFIFFFLFLSFNFPSLLLLLPTCVFLFLWTVLSAFFFVCVSLWVWLLLAASHLYISIIICGNTCPSASPKDCHTEPKPLALSVTENIATKPPLSVTVFHILSAWVYLFSVNRHIRVYWCCKC